MDPTINKPKTKKSSHKPLEMSATRPVSRFRQVIEVKNKDVRDPRFDNLSGKFNEDLFKKSYQFVQDFKEKELNELKKKLSKTKDPNSKFELKAQLNSEMSKIATEKRKEEQQQLKRNLRKEELELVKKGKKPFYLKKSAIRQIELTQQFNKIKDGKALDKIIEKRRKKNAAKAHKKLPFQRRSEE